MRSTATRVGRSPGIITFGKSVSAEIGYAIALNKKIIEFKPENVKVDTECMIDPGFHWIIESEDKLIELLKKLVGKR